jgi:hypothetical protein
MMAGNFGALKLFHMYHHTTNQVFMGHFNTPAEGRVIIADTGIFTADVWAAHLITWNGTIAETNYYVNNVLLGTKTSAVGFPSPWDPDSRLTFSTDYLGAGAYNTSYANGTIADYGRWNRVLDANERTTLQAGFGPGKIKRGLLEDRTFIANSSSKGSITEGPDLTLNAGTTPVWSPHYYGIALQQGIHIPDRTSTAGGGGPSGGGGGATDSASRLISPASWHFVQASLT